MASSSFMVSGSSAFSTSVQISASFGFPLRMCERWIDHFVNRGVLNTDSQKSCQSCSTSAGGDPEPSSIQIPRLSMRDDHSDQERKPKMTGKARSDRSCASCHVLGDDE